MILPDKFIEDRIINLDMVTPYNEAQLSPASYDIALGGAYRMPVSNNNWSEEIKFNNMRMLPGRFYLFHSLETIKLPDDIAAMLFMKSTYCRKGIEHLHACWIDPGFYGQITFEFTNCWPEPVRLEAGEIVAQLAFCMVATTCSRTYKTGHHYQGQMGPTKPWK